MTDNHMMRCWHVANKTEKPVYGFSLMQTRKIVSVLYLCRACYALVQTGVIDEVRAVVNKLDEGADAT